MKTISGRMAVIGACCILLGCNSEDEGAVRACASQGLEPCAKQLQIAARDGTAQDVFRWYLFKFMYTKGDEATVREASKHGSKLLNCAAIAGYEPAIEHAEGRLAYFGSLHGIGSGVIQQASDCLERKEKSLFGDDNRWMNCRAYRVLPICPDEFKRPLN